MTHRTTRRFWACYDRLPGEVQRLADADHELLETDPKHPSLHFKRVGRFWSIRVGIHYRALAVEADESVIWFWIGHHAEYDKLIGAA